MTEEWIEKVMRSVDVAEEAGTPKRLVDYDIVTSFAHFTPNLTIDEVFGYYRVGQLLEKSNGCLRVLLQDYDGTFPSKEKPRADCLETIFRSGGFQLGPSFFLQDVPMRFQGLDRRFCEQQLRHAMQTDIPRGPWRNKDARRAFEVRYHEVLQVVQNSLNAARDARAFLEAVRRGFLQLVGISVCAAAESRHMHLYAGKLEDDLAAGFPFWKMELPGKLAVKHMQNERTFLFYGVADGFQLVPVKFYEPTPRFEFETSRGEKCIIPAEESPKAMETGQLVPTSSLLNYICLSPARVKKDNGRKKRVHMGGNFMAGQNGYALEMLAYMNKVPGYDSVSLVCIGHDGRGTVRLKPRECIGFGVVYPYFGKKGLQQCFEQGRPFTLGTGNVFLE